MRKPVGTRSLSSTVLLESFRFKYGNVEYQYEIYLKAIARVLKKRHPGKLHVLIFFTKKVTTIICTEGS